MRTKLKVFTALFLLFATGPVAFGQSAIGYLAGKKVASDTVQYRMTTSVLNDSTIFKYELGGIALRKTGGYSFVGFQDSSRGSVGTGFYRSNTFTTSSHTDTLSFYRFAFFDNKAQITAVLDGKDTLFLHSVATSLLATYSSRDNKPIVPDTNYFNQSSSVLYIINLHAATTGFILAHLDTIRCWTSKTTHHLYYATTGNSASFRKLVLPLDSGASGYIDVVMVSNLKSGASLSTTGEVMNLQGATTAATYGYYHRIPKPVLPLIGSSVRTTISYPFSLAATTNPARRTLSTTLEANNALNVEMSLCTLNGSVVYSNKRILAKGLNHIDLPVSQLPAGAYLLRVFSDDYSADIKVVVLQ
jgi:hypothetical protein